MKKVLFLAIRFSNTKEGGGLYSDLIQEMQRSGHQVTVIAPAVDHSSEGLVLEHGIQVLRVTMPTSKFSGIIAKGLEKVLLPLLYKKAIKKHKLEMDFDWVLLPTPPITLGSLAAWVKQITGAQVYLILRDIFPQNALDLKMMTKNSLVYRYFRKKEKQLYTTADQIGCMSPANVDYIKKHNPDLDFSKLHLLPNWQKKPNPKDANKSTRSLEEKYGLQNKFVVLFGGNLGKPQKMENVLALAKKLIDKSDVVFLIIGDGTERERLREIVTSENISNVDIRNRIPREDYNQLIQIADLGLISLNEDFTIPNFPSKVLSYFAAKIPVLASVDLNTDFGNMLTDVGAGLWAPAGDIDAFHMQFLELYQHEEKRKVMGENGYRHMCNQLLPEHALATIQQSLLSQTEHHVSLS